jgi:hypothetical protein
LEHDLEALKEFLPAKSANPPVAASR